MSMQQYRMFGTMAPYQLWLEILLRSNGIHAQRRKRGDAIVAHTDAWVNAFTWSISLNRTGQELLRYLTCSEPELCRLKSKCSAILSTLFCASTGSVRASRMNVQMNIYNAPTSTASTARFSFLPLYQATPLHATTTAIFLRCGIHANKQLWVAPETISLMGIDPASDGAWYSDHDNSFTGVGVSFHCNLNKSPKSES